MDLTPYLELLRDKRGSDLFFSAGSPVRIRIEGQMSTVGTQILNGAQTLAAAYGLMTQPQMDRFERTLECDFAVALVDGTARFRVNVFRQRGEVSLVLRLVPAKIPTIDDFGLPEILKTLALHKRGLILMAGATGSGKSTTLAAMLNERNQRGSGHILTIEDPIEFSHPNLRCIVNQREVGVDTLSFRAALRASLREAPDVILIGEIRDRETMEAALELCNTGHLCLSTLHANNANQALERLINLYPQELHRQLLLDLSLNVRAVIGQRLVRGVEGTRVAAIEILLSTPYIAELILAGDLHGVKEAMASSSTPGMQTFDDALLALYRGGRVSLEEALANADSRTNLEARINFG